MAERMTREEFLTELSGLGLVWHIEEGQRIRCDNGDCPIEAVGRARDGFRPPSPWEVSWLSHYLVDEIVRMADARGARGRAALRRACKV